jgi:hypothetical protein
MAGIRNTRSVSIAFSTSSALSPTFDEYAVRRCSSRSTTFAALSALIPSEKSLNSSSVVPMSVGTPFAAPSRMVSIALVGRTSSPTTGWNGRRRPPSSSIPPPRT